MIVEKLEAGKAYELSKNVVEMEFEAIKEWCEANDYIMIYQTGIVPPHYIYWLIPGDKFKAGMERKFLYGDSDGTPAGFLSDDNHSSM